MYLALKYTHIACAALTIAGFTLRGFWMLASSPALNVRFVRIAPHVVDTVFLLSGIAMLMLSGTNPFLQAWLVAKFAGLLVYIVLGSIAIRHGATMRSRATAFAGALAVFAYIAGVAVTRSAFSWAAAWS